MKHAFIVGLLSLCVTSCSTVEHVPRETLRARAFDLSMKPHLDQLTSTNVVVTFKDDREERVAFFNMRRDSAMWLEGDSERPVIVSNDQMRSVTIRDMRRGMLHGIGFGAAVGTGLGVALALRNGGAGEYSPGSTILMGALSGAAVGELLGFFIGAPVTYTFDPLPVD